MTAQPAAFLITHATDPDNPIVVRGDDFDAMPITSAMIDGLYRRNDVAPTRVPLIDQDDCLRGFIGVTPDYHHRIRVFVDQDGIVWHAASGSETAAMTGQIVELTHARDVERRRGDRLEQMLRNLIDGHLSKPNASKLLTEMTNGTA